MMAAGRIRQTLVPAHFPASGPVHVLLVGEAPGPRGADQSGIPFWGDRAGKLVYRALQAADLADVPAAAWPEWDGARFQEQGLFPTLRGAALSNAFPQCPTRDGHTFRAPTDRELRQPENLARILAELARAAKRCPGKLHVIVFGGHARRLFERLPGASPFQLHSLPHPSAQGLLSTAPDRGKGRKLADLERAWEEQLMRLLDLAKQDKEKR